MMNAMTAFLPGCAVFFMVCCCAAAEPEFLAPERTAQILTEKIREASGLSVYSRDESFLWIVNDSGAAPAIHLLESNGSPRGKVTLEGARNIDWEDLSSFTLDGQPYLLVADTGDNAAKRETCTLYVLHEPQAPAAGITLDDKAHIAWRIDFRYESGPRDCEAVAVDVPSKKILLLSKRTTPPELHELPLKPADTSVVQITRKIGTLEVSAPMDGNIPFRSQPTGMNISADNKLAAVITYYGVFLFPREAGEDWQQAFARKPRILQPHLLAQAEAIAFTPHSGNIVAVSEGRNSKIATYRKSTR
jgi:hypothetical protein